MRKSNLYYTDSEYMDDSMEHLVSAYLKRVNDFNFTAHREEERFRVLNIQDSVQPFEEQCFEIPDGAHVADIGTGGGFPGMPLAVLRLDAHFTLMDSVGKKLHLIDSVAKECGIENVRTVHGRLEELGQRPSYREHFDVVTSKAVAQLATLLELALPLVKVGGHAALYQSEAVREELPLLQEVVELLGGGTPVCTSYSLSGEYGSRVMVVIPKVKPTPGQYPRKVGVPKEKPLS